MRDNIDDLDAPVLCGEEKVRTGMDRKSWEDMKSARTGQVRVYSWNGSTWAQRGSYMDGEATGSTRFGASTPESGALNRAD